MDALGPLLAVVIPLATGAFAWLFYREFLINDRFWIVVVALAIAGILVQNGYTKEAAVVFLVGIGVWLWLEYRSREDEE
jgi:chromate transport protein ChrA